MNTKIEMKDTSTTAVLLMSCPDQVGIVARVSEFISEHKGSVVDLNQHTDADAGIFLMRVEWRIDGFDIPRGDIKARLGEILAPFGGSSNIYFSDERTRIAVWVSKQDHCLLDLLSRSRSEEFTGDIVVVMSNHPELKSVADYFSIPFVHVPVADIEEKSYEKKQKEVIAEYKVGLIVLAKYMRVVSSDFISHFPNIINIHHSSLPSFPGANPYKQARDRGVKIIGATAHYVTAELDAGPIISQSVVRVSHRDSVEDLKRMGRDVERRVLAYAVRLHLLHRVIVYKNRTAVFD